VSTTEKVSAVMSHTTVSISPTTTLRDVANILVREEIGAVVVREGEAEAVGMVSERDLVGAIAEDSDLDSDRASDVMAYDVQKVGPDDDVATAARQMLDGNIRHLPVLDGAKVVGILSIRDVLAHVLN